MTAFDPKRSFRVRLVSVNRRDSVLAMLALGAVPFASLAQQSTKIRRIGFLSPSSAALAGPYSAELRRGLLEAGYIEGTHYISEQRFAEGKNERLSELAVELVKLNVDVIFAATTNAAIAAQKATATIPIVFVAVADPIAAGFAESLARPGRNMTGLSNFAGDLQPKRIELLSMTIPNLRNVAAFLNPTNPYIATRMKEIRSAADAIGVRLTTTSWDAVQDIEAVFAKMSREGVQAMVISGDTYHFDQRARIADAAIRHRIASISPFREYTQVGALMSYGTSAKAQFRQVAAYLSKILRGAKPADLPIEQPTNFEFLVNLKTAKSIGIAIPQSVLARADEVIQ